MKDNRIDIITSKISKLKKLSETTVKNLFKIDDNYIIILKEGETFFLDNRGVDILSSFKCKKIDKYYVYDLNNRFF